MKVKDLIAQLEQLDQNLQVVVSSDAEGNTFNPLAELSTQMYVEDGDVFGEDDFEDQETEYQENAVVLWPE